MSGQNVVAAVLLVLVVGLLIWWQTRPPAADEPDEDTAVTTITFAAYEQNAAALEPFVNAFMEAHPGIRVQLAPLDVNLNTWQVASLADTVILPPTANGDAPAFQPLAPLQAADSQFDATFWPGLRESCGAGALPLGAAVDLIYYDTEAFTAANLPLPQPGWSWADFQTAVAQLAQRDGAATDRYGFAPLHRHPLAAHPDARPLFEDPEAAGAAAASLTWYLDAIDDGLIPAAGRLVEDTQSLINDGQAAMWNDSYRALGRRGPAAAVVPFPVGDEGLPTSPAFSLCVGMSAGTAQPQAAWTWLAWLVSQPDVALALGWLPARPAFFAAADVPELAEETKPVVQAALENGWYAPAGYYRAFDDAIFAALEQGIPLAEALASQLTAWADAQRESETAVSITLPTPAPAVGNDGLPVVTFHLGTPVRNEAIFDLAQTFDEQRPNFRFQVSTRWPTAATAVSARDVAAQADCYLWEWGFDPVKESLLPLDPLLDADSDDLLADIWPGAAEPFRVDGQLYALPLAIAPTAVFYNADLLAERGLPLPAMDWTFDDFLALAQAAAVPADEAADRRYGYVPLINLDFILSGQEVMLYDLAANPPQAFLNAPDTVSTVNWLLAQVAEGVLPPLNDAAGDDAIRNGQAAFWLDSGGRLQNKYWSAYGTPFNFGLAPIPAGANVPPQRAVSFRIPSWSTNPQACYDWYRLLSAAPAVTDLLPARQSVAADPVWQTYAANQMATYAPANMQAYFTDEVTPGSNQISAGDPLAIYEAGAALIETSGYFELTVPVDTAAPLDYWWEQAINTAAAGADAADVLNVAQSQAEDYLACLGQAQSRTPNMILDCAKLADTDFVRPFNWDVSDGDVD